MLIDTGCQMTPGEAIDRYVEPGMALHLSFGDARPNALVKEVVRRFRGTDPAFTVITSGLLNTQQALVGAGLVRRLLTSFAGENYPIPQPSPVIRRGIDDGSLQVEDWSLYTLVAGLMAGALGIPFFPVRSFADGSMTGRPGMAPRADLDDPFGGGTVTVVPAIHPDLTLIHGVIGDVDGNILLAGPGGEREWGALASRRGVIATVERIVDRDELARHASQVRIPAAAVLAVCEVPRGSHPYGAYTAGIAGVPSYDEDVASIVQMREEMGTAEAHAKWVDQWLAAPQPTRIAASPPPAPHPCHYTDSELMVISAARRIEERLREEGHDHLLAGIGQANLAAWLAHEHLSAVGAAPSLMAEMGMVGYRPQPGDPYIFANRNKPGCVQLVDTLSVLGSYVGHHRMKTLAVVGAGQVDQDGAINSSVGHDGRYLTGSGGVNDIASVADELLVVLRQSPKRLVPDVPVVTAPGRAVRTVVTDRAVFRRGPEGFTLSHVLVPHDRQANHTGELVAEIRARTGWEQIAWPDDPIREAPPTPEELASLRAYDPSRHFLR